MMSIIERMPKVNGKLQANAPLGKKSHFGVGGTAEVLFEPSDMDDLVFFLRRIPKDIPIIPLGAMSNVLIREKGIEGVVVVLGDWFKKLYIEDEILEVGAGVPCSKLSTVAMDRELGGLEFLMGLPGTIGGAIKMNAGCFGSEISNVLIECEGITTAGKVEWFKVKDIGATYRHTNIPDDCIITRAWFRGIPNVSYSIPKRTREFMEQRRNSQPLGVRTCGSTFKNPDGLKAWQLIEKAGCRGLRVGGAQISEKHCNFIVNTGNATANDVEDLGERVAQEVLQKTGVQLEWEIVKLGRKGND
jgi:UDP-N-acetylmuramate dehydrogenase